MLGTPAGLFFIIKIIPGKYSQLLSPPGISDKNVRKAILFNKFIEDSLPNNPRPASLAKRISTVKEYQKSSSAMGKDWGYLPKVIKKNNLPSNF